jgi:energy-coupling factor transporter ATP-binding protein EcfA2
MHIYPTSLTLEPGSFNMLLGTTLAGKTTLMQLMAGLEPRPGRDLVQRRDVTGCAGPEAQRVDGLPAVHQLPQHERLREHRLAAAGGAAPSPRRDQAPGGEMAELMKLFADARPRPRSCRAASSSAPPWRARWSRIPISSCSTNRSPTSTTSCARSCATNCRSSSPSAVRRRLRHDRADRGAAVRRPHRALHEGRVPSSDHRPASTAARHLTAKVFSDPPINTAPW